MGQKGLVTRQRLITTTVALLETTPLRELRVAEIAAAARTAPATFYVYFGAVQDVVLAAAGELSQSTPEIMALVRGSWAAGHAAETARALVRSYVGFWDAHRTVLRVRNLAAEEGDEGFRAARESAILPLLHGLAAQVEVAQAAGRIPARLHPNAIAGVLLAMLERLGAIVHLRPNAVGVAPGQLLEAAAHQVEATLGLN